MNALDLAILLTAFIAGLLVLATHVPLGMKVLARDIIFADLAVAQIAGLGVIAAGLLELEGRPLLVQGIAAASALCGAALLTLIERKLPDVLEACIGLLVGQILWVSNGQLIATAVLTAALLALWRVFDRRLGNFGFYALFAFAVTASVQLVGVYLVFASLIVPALATHRLQRWRKSAAYAVGVAGYAGGLLLSVWFDLPTGAAIVWAMAVSGALFALLKRGA